MPAPSPALLTDALAWVWAHGLTLGLAVICCLLIKELFDAYDLLEQTVKAAEHFKTMQEQDRKIAEARISKYQAQISDLQAQVRRMLPTYVEPRK